LKLFPNLGGEEGPRWREATSQPAVRQMARLWRCLFPDACAWTGVGAADAPPSDWPEALGPPAETPVFEWIAGLGGVVPWLATDEAERLGGPAAAPVARTHDKAFAQRFADREGFTPPALRGLGRVFDADAVAAGSGWIDQVRAALADWPTWTGGRFALKPRLGSSGRGRVAGEASTLDAAALEGAAPRLARQGGALLEPWLDRRQDLATCLHIAPDRTLSVLGSLRPWLTAAGSPLGHRGGVDSRGRVFSESAFEEEAREAAAALATEAAREGLRGPCGVDALVFALPEPEGGARPCLRPIVELNARFTAGLVTIGLVRRALPLVRRAIALEPGVRRAFLLGLRPPSGPAADEPPTTDAWDAALQRAGDGAALLRLGGPRGADDAALLFASSDQAIDAALGAA
jgi:hypothetical protein